MAPGGFRGLNANRDYYYAGRCDDRETITLCFFSSDPIDVHLEVLSQPAFEQAVLDDLLVPVDRSSPYPPWVEQFAGESSSHRYARSISEHIANNHAHISRWKERLTPLLSKSNDILSVENPYKPINKHITGVSSRSQVKKGRILFFAWLCFGRSDAALLPFTLKNGRFNRDDSPPKNKYGPKNKRTGEFSGHHCGPTERELCIKGYERHRTPGLPYSEIYRRTLETEFKCDSRIVDGKYETYQPTGNAYPSQRQFMTRVFDHFGYTTVHNMRFSTERVRRTKKEHVGTFSERCSNILERIEADVYYVCETAKGVSADYSAVLCIARTLDTTTSLRTGIGCSLNGEKSDAYAMAEFSMGIPKDVFCSYFGITIDRSHWPSFGLPMRNIADKGAGSKEDLIDTMLQFSPNFEMAKSYSGQSKAPIEASNPRVTKMEGAPCYVVSHLNVFEYFKREIVRTYTENWTSDISAHLTKSMIENGVKPRPIHVWNYLAQRCRTDGIDVDFDELVRKFLPKRTIKINRQGAWLSILRFKSEALTEAGLCERVSGNRSYELEAYILPMSLRQMWIDWNGRLVEVHLVPPMVDGGGEYEWTVKDLEDLSRRRKALIAEAKEEDLAVRIAASKMFEEQTGKKFDGGTSRRARPKRKSRDSMDELAQIHAVFGRSK